MTSPLVTVAVCTRDRVDVLRRTAPPLLAEVAADPTIEVLYVDNGSTDGTAAYLADVWGRRARVVFEARPGLSLARNRALASARAPYVAFLDDDARVRPGWRAALTASTGAPGPPVAVAGRVVLVGQGRSPRPVLLQHPHVQALLSACDHGSVRRVLEPHEGPVGANMVVDRAAALAVDGFDPALGRRGRQLLSMEEVDFFRRLRSSSERPVLWEPGLTVEHLVPVHRITWSFALRRTFWQGRSERRLQQRQGQRRGALRSGAAAGRHLVAAVVPGTEGQWTSGLLSASFEAGRAFEALALRRQWPSRSDT